MAPPRVRPATARRPYLVGVAVVLAAVLVLGAVASGAVIALRHHQTAGVPASAPSPQAVFQMPYRKGVRSARFREVEHAGGSTITGSGVIEFAPDHAFSETLSGKFGIFERDVEVGGVGYDSVGGEKYRATDTELLHFQSLGWDGSAPPQQLKIVSQTTVAGQLAWVLKEGSTRWIVGEQTGDPLEAIVYGSDTFTFSHWGKAPAIHAPSAHQVSTDRYSGSGTNPVVAPAATVTVLREQWDKSASQAAPAGFRTLALEISYKNTASSASDFDDFFSLVSSDGVFAYTGFTTLSPGLQAGTGVSPGQTITGWAGFNVPRKATNFHLLFGEQSDQTQTLDYLISTSVGLPH
ncbi:MAG: hypothetical protein J2P38_11480 [Candidatus Dormibacteraeota bacterium]|nr:hypothetical protein [Candidatus Dormibacteraeota bacterium]